MHVHIQPGWLRSYAGKIVSGAAFAACFPSWIQGTCLEFSNGEETRCCKREIRGNYIVICHEIFLCCWKGIPSASNSAVICILHSLVAIYFLLPRMSPFSPAIPLCIFSPWLLFKGFVRLRRTVFSSVTPARLIWKINLASGVDQWVWSGEIIGIAEISM